MPRLLCFPLALLSSRAGIGDQPALRAKTRPFDVSTTRLTTTSKARAGFGKYRFGGQSTLGIFLHGVVGRRHFIVQPSLHRCVAFLEGAQAGADDFAARGVGAGRHFCVDEGGVLRRQAKRSLRDFRHVPSCRGMTKSYHPKSHDVDVVEIPQSTARMPARRITSPQRVASDLMMASSSSGELGST